MTSSKKMPPSVMSSPDNQEKEVSSDSYSNWKEYRRQLAWDMVQRGMEQKTVAELLDVTQAAVSQWVKRAREEGRAALEAKPTPERAKKLAKEHVDKLVDWLSEGAQAHGFGERWTTSSVAELIENRFGVEYHPAHVSRMLKQWGFVWVGISGWVVMQ